VIVVAARGSVRFVGWCVALAVTLVGLHLLPVPDGAPDLASRDPADLLPVLLRGGRWVGLLCAWYLAGATALSALAAVVAWRPLRRVDAALTIPAVRHLVRAGLGASLALGLGLGPTTAAVAAPGPPGASAQPTQLAEVPDVAEAPDLAEPPGRRPRLLPPVVADPRTPEADEPQVDDLDRRPPATVARLAATASAPDEDAVHEVVAGESFWSIAADLTEAELGRAPDDEVFERWVALIDDNRDRLLVPDDPDLLLPGQVLRVGRGG
jgi:hypothetical protein